jgi:hypothetical protein
MPVLAKICEVMFSPNSVNKKYRAKEVFLQSFKKVTGTFETSTGDYSYLQGTYKNDSLFLPTFDGAYLFLFKAIIKNHVITDTFFTGNHWEE